jgi:putative hydrolase of the HAD superfamily
MVAPQAFLVDVYDTLVTCDFDALRNGLPAIAGAEPQAWHDAFARLGPELALGRLSLARAFEQILVACSIKPKPGLVSELVRKDRELLAASSRPFEDAVPFLQSLRSSGVRVALVSNCIENTRPLLSDLGFTALADAVVLSCEAGCVKPDARIYQAALDQLGVTAGAAVFVDDQPAYCAAAVAMGMSAVQIARPEMPLLTPASGTAVIRSLLQATTMI